MSCRRLLSTTGLSIIMLAGPAFSRPQQPAEPKPSAPPQEEQGQLPPEEDKARLPKEYSFNPLQSKKEVTVGEFYFKKGDFLAASTRFREATQWNPGNAEAWLRLGEASEKKHAPKEAREAYLKYVELAPEAKNIAEVRKRIEKLKN